MRSGGIKGGRRGEKLQELQLPSSVKATRTSHRKDREHKPHMQLFTVRQACGGMALILSNTILR